jgi:hypothetical protein
LIVDKTKGDKHIEKTKNIKGKERVNYLTFVEAGRLDAYFHQGKVAIVSNDNLQITIETMGEGKFISQGKKLVTRKQFCKQCEIEELENDNKLDFYLDNNPDFVRYTYYEFRLKDKLKNKTVYPYGGLETKLDEAIKKAKKYLKNYQR